MQRRYPLSARQLVLLSSVLALLPAVLFGGYAIYSLIARDQIAQKSYLVDTARALSIGLDREIQAMQQISAVLAGSRLLAVHNLAAFDDLARDSASVGRYDVVLTNARGQQLINTRMEPGQPLPHSRNIALIEEVVRSGEPRVSNLTRRTSDDQHSIAILSRVKAGEETYVLILMPHLDALGDLFHRVALSDGWIAAIDDPTGAIVARSVDAAKYVGTRARLQTPQGGAGLREFVDLEGRPSVMAYFVSPDSGYRAVAWAPESVFYASSRTLTSWFSAVALLALAITIVTALAASRLVRQPILDLVDTARRLAAGNRVQHTCSIMSEANIVGAALETASQEISMREAALRKESEKTLMLARELAHRTKNVMAVVSAIARQSLRSATNVSAFARVFEDRLAGLSRSLDLLVDTDWEGVLLEALVRQQLLAFADAGRFSISGPPVLLAPAAVQNIGMALHELATNAVKYGALATATGNVFISWSLDGDEFRFEWREIDGDAVAVPERKGFGRSVIEELAPNSLSGSAELVFDSEGLRWTLTAPSADVTARTPTHGAQ